MMFAQYPECDAIFMPSAAENNAAATRGVTASPSNSNDAMHTDGEAKATICVTHENRKFKVSGGNLMVHA